MYLEIDYEERNAGIRIWRCRGYGEVLKVPEMLEGKMVTELAPYALSSSRGARSVCHKACSAETGREGFWGAF